MERGKWKAIYHGTSLGWTNSAQPLLPSSSLNQSNMQCCFDSPRLSWAHCLLREPRSQTWLVSRAGRRRTSPKPTMKWSSTNKVSPGHALSQVWFLLLQVHREERSCWELHVEWAPRGVCLCILDALGKQAGVPVVTVHLLNTPVQQA